MIRSVRSWVEISKSSLIHNVNVFRKVVGNNVLIMAIVKSNAYGHGVKQVAKILEKTKTVNLFGVDSISEAVDLRLINVKKPILVLGYTPFYRLSDASKYKISISVYDIQTLKKLANLKRNINIHLKIDTGMGRQGIKENEVNEFLDVLMANRNVNLEGIFTHFATADEENKNFTNFQIEDFKKILKMISKRKISPSMIHSSATSGTALYPDAHFDLVRAGIGIYGLFPSMHVKEKNNFRIKPVLSWKCYIAKIKIIKSGESVGYGGTWIAKTNRKIALVPTGYYDGYDRKLSNNGNVIVKGKLVPIVGRISMNMMTIDVTDVNGVKLEDEVVLIGKQGHVEVTADDLARQIGTINYEVVTRINLTLPRIVI